MSDATSLLYDLEGFEVVSVADADDGLRRVVIMQIAVEHACPRCGVLVGGKPFDVRESGVKDLPMGHRCGGDLAEASLSVAGRRLRAAGVRRAVGADPAAVSLDRPVTGSAGVRGVGFGAGAVRCGGGVPRHDFWQRSDRTSEDHRHMWS